MVPVLVHPMFPVGSMFPYLMLKNTNAKQKKSENKLPRHEHQSKPDVRIMSS